MQLSLPSKSVIRLIEGTILTLVFSASTVLADQPDPAKLLNDYYSNARGELKNGQAVLLRSVTRPIFKPEFFNPAPAQTAPAEKDAPVDHKWQSQKRTLELEYSVNFGNMPEHQYQASKVYVDGKHKRMDSNGTELTAEVFAKLNGHPPHFTDIPLSENYDDGKKTTSLMIHGEISERDPQAVIMGLRLDVPEILYFGRPGIKQNDIKQFSEILKPYKVSARSTDEGYIVIAESEKNELRKIELLFDPKHDFDVKRERCFNDRIMTEERVFDDYFQCPSGVKVPRSIITRKFCPVPQSKDHAQLVTPLERVTYEEQITVISADYNIKFPADLFIPHLPEGTTVYDASVTPNVQYKTPKDKKSSTTQPGK